MKNKMLKITAKHKKTGLVVDLEYYSIKQAKFHNPYLVDFRVIGYVGGK